MDKPVAPCSPACGSRRLRPICFAGGRSFDHRVARHESISPKTSGCWGECISRILGHVSCGQTLPAAGLHRPMQRRGGHLPASVADTYAQLLCRDGSGWPVAHSGSVAYVSRFYPSNRQGTALEFGVGKVAQPHKWCALRVAVVRWERVALVWAGDGVMRRFWLAPRIRDAASPGRRAPGALPGEFATLRDARVGVSQLFLRLRCLRWAALWLPAI